jgi:hypothetical protein
MTTIKRSGPLTILSCGALLLVWHLLRPATVTAQWTTPDANQNINNTNTGNVGIGTSTPGRKLEVLATDGEALRLYRNAGNVGWGVNVKFAFNNSNGMRLDYVGLHGLVANATAGSEAGDFVLTTVSSGSLTEKLRVTSAGNLGIGTSTPTTAAGYTALSLNNTTGTLVDFMTSNVLKARLQSDGTTFYFNNLANGPIQIYTNSTERMRIDAAGNIGIGTTAPTSRLHVGGTNDNLFQVVGTGSAATDTIAHFSSAVGTNLIVRGNGYVGIGTTSPASKLHVAGSITVDGNINAKYQDVAEWVPSTQQLTPATVVVLDADKSNEVVASTHSYDTRVAGVISAQPGIALGESGAGKVLVATTGRVRVRVDASRSAIHTGDLLVTSDIPGVAMKSETVNIGGIQLHRPGTLIGKALEPLEKGSGEILVLLSLQ